MKTASSLLETTKTTNLAIWHNSLQLLHLQTLVFRSSCTTHSLAACIRNWGQYALSCLPKPERHKPGIDRLCQISGFLARLNATSVKIWHASSGACPQTREGYSNAVRPSDAVSILESLYSDRTFTSSFSLASSYSSLLLSQEDIIRR
jgi:hypothetical protein